MINLKGAVLMKKIKELIGIIIDFSQYIIKTRFLNYIKLFINFRIIKDRILEFSTKLVYYALNSEYGKSITELFVTHSHFQNHMQIHLCLLNTDKTQLQMSRTGSEEVHG